MRAPVVTLYSLSFPPSPQSVDKATRQRVADVLLGMASLYAGITAMSRIPSQLGGRLSLLIEPLGGVPDPRWGVGTAS
jgi:hypothetical protein